MGSSFVKLSTLAACQLPTSVARHTDMIHICQMTQNEVHMCWRTCTMELEIRLISCCWLMNDDFITLFGGWPITNLVDLCPVLLVFRLRPFDCDEWRLSCIDDWRSYSETLCSSFWELLRGHHNHWPSSYITARHVLQPGQYFNFRWSNGKKGKGSLKLL